MKIISLIFSVVSLLFFSISCDNDDIARDGRPPEFGKLTLTPSTVAPSDSVIAIVSYKYPGKKILKSEYELKITGNTSSGQYNNSIKWEVIDPTKKEPFCKFAAPDEAGIYNVTFRNNQIEYTSHGANGSPFATVNVSVSAVLNVQSKE